MIDDRIIQIKEHGMSRIDFGIQWKSEARKRGLRDPWEHSPHRAIRTHEVLTKIAGVEVPATKTVYNECSDEELSAWRSERDEYIRQRDEWIALQMFNRYGYEAFLDECNNLSEVFQKSIFPCESNGDPQCSMFCSAFKDCPLRGREGGGEASDY